MQHKKFLSPVIVGVWVSFLVCLGCGSTTTGKEATPGSSATSEVSSGDASFSVSIDGTPVSGGTIDDLQLQNTAFIYPPQNNGPQTVLFYLFSTKKGDDFYSFRFSLPDKEGEYHPAYNGYSETHASVVLDFNLRSADNFARYNEDSVTVIVDKITSTRISGTFSGILRLSSDTRSKPYKEKVIVSDGKFDIPFSTGNLRPQ